MYLEVKVQISLTLPHLISGPITDILKKHVFMFKREGKKHMF